MRASNAVALNKITCLLERGGLGNEAKESIGEETVAVTRHKAA